MDKKTIINEIESVKSALPEPTQEEIENTLEYQLVLQKKRKQKRLKRVLIGITASILIILISSIFMMFFRDEDLFNKFMNSLDEKQQQLYNKIIKERTMIYLLGMFIGLILGSIHFYYKRNICFFVCIVFITQMIIYKIYPKSTYM